MNYPEPLITARDGWVGRGDGRRREQVTVMKEALYNNSKLNCRNFEIHDTAKGSYMKDRLSEGFSSVSGSPCVFHLTAA